MSACDFSALDDAGLNLQAVFDLDQLPEDSLAALRRQFDPAQRYRQLILIGHAGKSMWAALKATGIDSENPVDDFSVQTAERWFATQFPGCAQRIIYPGYLPVGLQALGKMAGWHHASPFMIGINEQWGTWYAYRVVMLTGTGLPPTPPVHSESPCASCRDAVCRSSCPAGAMDGETFALHRCVSYRKTAGSLCRATCIARLSCPVGSAHRYCDEQIQHTYSISMRNIERYY